MQLTVPELTAARDALRQAEALVTGVRVIFRSAGKHATAARLKNISGRLADEATSLDKAIGAAKP